MFDGKFMIGVTITGRQEEYHDAVDAAMKHLDACEVPADSISRGFVKVHLACQMNPILKALMQEMYPTNPTLTQ